MGRYKQPFSLFKRGKYWYYRTYINGFRTTAKTTGQKSKSAAIALLNQMFKDNRLVVSEITFGEFAKDFLSDDSAYLNDRTTKLTERTIKSYRITMREHLMPKFKDIKLNDINYSMLKDFRVELLGKIKPSYVQKVFTLFNRILKVAYRDNLILRNPFDGLEALTIKTDGVDAFTLDEVVFLAQNCPEFRQLILLQALTGMRISEAVGVRKSDVLIENGIEYIELSKQLIKHKYEPLKTKYKRRIPIVPEIKELIYSHEPSAPKFYRYFIPVQRKCKDAEKRNLRDHSLRHFFITNSKSFGINSDKVEIIAGHTLDGIKDVYTNFSVENLAEINRWQENIVERLKKESLLQNETKGL